ncbi:MAG: carbohydrate kinase family protein [Anaerolineae bacterium]|nr:carbohydrate kinase family protein [Anaerolineae bacterium]NUQ02495.1 carbohydrate kinase family protein [Anaerolineae bacterium]
MNSVDIVVCGHLCLDLLPKMDHVDAQALASPGKLSEVGPLGISTGGAVSNTGLALHRLGANVALMSNVGSDLLGQMIIAFLEKRDSSLTRFIRVREGQESSYTIVLSPEKIDRVFLHCTGTNALFGSLDVDYAMVDHAKIFHLGYPPILPRMYAKDGDELVEIFRKVHQAGVITSLDMSLPDPSSESGHANWHRILERVLPNVDVFVPSIEEALFMVHPEQQKTMRRAWHEFATLSYLRDLADELLAMGNCALVGFKLGEYGVYLKSGSAQRMRRIFKRIGHVNIAPESEQFHPAFLVDVVGTTGAGDSAYGALLLSIIRGESLEVCTQMMCAVGAHNVEAADATSGVRSWDETVIRIQAGWKTSALTLRAV